jgi:hypothetical protein
VTHDDLVELGAKYLKSVHKVNGRVRIRPHAVITTGIGAGEIPDVLAYLGSGVTTLIEAKVSRSDFRADAKKYFRREPERGMGNYRYYLAPKGMISVDELPARWGLMEEHNGRVRLTKVASHQASERRNEVCVLLSLTRRIGQNAPQGVSVKFYMYETGNTCTAGVASDVPITEVPVDQAEEIGQMEIEAAILKHLGRLYDLVQTWDAGDMGDVADEISGYTAEWKAKLEGDAGSTDEEEA